MKDLSTHHNGKESQDAKDECGEDQRNEEGWLDLCLPEDVLDFREFVINGGVLDVSRRLQSQRSKLPQERLERSITHNQCRAVHTGETLEGTRRLFKKSNKNKRIIEKRALKF